VRGFARLYTGARALADTEASRVWARDRLLADVQATPPGASLIAGGAEGADTYLREVVLATNAELPRERRRRLVEFRLDGRRWVDNQQADGNDAALKPTWRWADLVDGAREARGAEWPKLRDRAMVEALAGARERGYACSALALHAPWSSTHGTAYTARLAEQAGFRVDRASCPAEMAPSNASAHEIVWVDLETGGLSEHRNPILEIAAIRTSPDASRVLGVFRRLTQPLAGLVVDEGARRVVGYSEARWAGAAPLADALREFLAFCPPAPFTLGGFNVRKFDLKFLAKNLERLGLPALGCAPDLIDVADFARACKAEQDRGPGPSRMPNWKLGTFCAFYGLPTEDAHRADVDIARTLRLYQICRGVEPVGEQPPLSPPAEPGAESTEAA
jgi:DNA polymerase III epsilon subunit-like protein